MTSSRCFDTKAEADAFIYGLTLSGGYEAWLVESSGKPTVKFYKRW